MTHTALGVAAGTWGVAMAVAPVLQIRQILRARSSKGLSLGYMSVLLVGFVLWVAYGVAGGDVPLIVPNAIALAVMAATIAMALRHR
jgi:MtN3 and saliva related transmembrane protein